MIRITFLVPLFLLMACGNEPSINPSDYVRETDIQQTSGGNFVLFISNQSFDRPLVDITVEIDGEVAASDLFPVESQHTWIDHTFQLEKGQHTITISSEAGNAELKEEFTLSAPKHYAVVSYWYREEDQPPKFTFKLSSRPIGFL